MALHLLAVGTFSPGHTSLRVAPHNQEVAAELEEYLCAPDGTLQLAIDFAAELQELEDDILDREFWRSGQW